MWRRALLLAWFSALPSCGLVENFDGYSDRFDGGAPPASEDTAAGGDTSMGVDTHGDDVAKIDSNGVDTTTGVDTSTSLDTSVTDLGVDTACDPTACAASKGPLATCSGATCVCPTGTDECAGKCTHLDRDPENCGSCGTPVDDGAHWCIGSKSVCRPGTSPCKTWVTSGTPSYTVDCTNSASCTDNLSDGSHCTATSTSIQRCYNSPSASRCIGGSCFLSSCPTDHKACPSTITGSESCWDIKHDSNNCGDCNKKCLPTEVCSDGACVPYRPAKSCAECVGALSKCCTSWTIPVCIAASAACPATPGS